MNRLLFKFSLLALLPIFILVSFASAQSGLLFGQNHFYTVIFRGNGEAIVYAKLAFTNSEEQPLTDFSFEIPKVSPTELAIYQIKLPQQCVNYNYNNPERPCLQYQEPDYTESNYYYDYSQGKTEYQKIEYTKSGNLYKLVLPTAVEPYKSSAILVAYAAKGYVDKSSGLYKFNFETLKVPSRIQAVQVAVDVDADLLLKGKRSSVNYSTPGVAPAEFAVSQGVSNAQLDAVVRNVGYGSPLVKEAKNLAPNESFMVKGEYATNWFRLYLSSIIWTVVIIALILFGIYLLKKLLHRRRGRNGESDEEGPNSEQAINSGRDSFSVLNLSHTLLGLLSAALVVGLTYLLNLLSEADWPYVFDYNPFFAIIGFITIILLYVLIIFGPAIYAATKHGWRGFAAVLITEFLWLVFFLIVYFVLFQSGLTSRFFGRGYVVY